MLIPNIQSEQDTPTNSVGEFVKKWNIDFPLDRWYRKKFNIKWGSDEHRETTLFSIHFEYQEETIFNRVREEIEKEEKKEKYTPGDWFNTEGEDIEGDSAFDQLDISKIGDDGEITLKQEE